MNWYRLSIPRFLQDHVLQPRNGGKIQDQNIWLIRDYWYLQTSVLMWCHNVMTSRCHYDNKCNSLQFTLHKLWISENRQCISHRCPADSNENNMIIIMKTFWWIFIISCATLPTTLASWWQKLCPWFPQQEIEPWSSTQQSCTVI